MGGLLFFVLPILAHIAGDMGASHWGNQSPRIGVLSPLQDDLLAWASLTRCNAMYTLIYMHIIILCL